MPYPCFSYPADMPQGIRNPRTMPHTCFSYLTEVPRSMPVPCFSYPAPRGSGRVPGHPCFSYPDDIPLGNRNRGDAQPTSPEVRSVPYSCFRY